MPEPVGLDKVYSAVEETADLLGVPCSPEQFAPAVAAFGDELREAHIVFSMAAGEAHRGELDFDFSVSTKGADPYATALANGLIKGTDHPVGALLTDIQARHAVASYGVEYGILGGFKKSYAFFPIGDYPPLAEFAAIPSVPPGISEHVDTLTRLGLQDTVSAIGVNYAKRTLNVYLGVGEVATETKLELLRTFGFPEPDAEVAEFVKRSFSMYPTFNWDSSVVERICFSVKTQDPGELPAPFHPEIEKFASGVPHSYAGGREFVSAVALAPSGEAYYKLAAYYQKAQGDSKAAFAASREDDAA
ncbi:aromatic prenyltransferase [Streptomyces xanthophaeus]